MTDPLEPRDRIVELRRIPAGELVPNDRNWRTHPSDQIEALRGSLTEIGIADVAIAVERDGRVILIDGHARQEQLADDYPVPTLILDLDDDEADLMLAVLDPLAAMADTDPTRLAELLLGIDTNDYGLGLLIDQLADRSTELEARPVKVPDEFPNVDVDGFDLEHTCPRCGYEFS